MNEFGCIFELGDRVKLSGINYAPELDEEMGVTPDSVGIVNDYSIINGQVHMIGVLWLGLNYESPYLPDEIAKEIVNG